MLIHAYLRLSLLKKGVPQMLDDQKIEAQQILDQLFSEHLLHFKLSASVVDSIGSEEYMIRFNDSRLPSIDVSWRQGPKV